MDITIIECKYIVTLKTITNKQSYRLIDKIINRCINLSLSIPTALFFHSYSPTDTTFFLFYFPCFFSSSPSFPFFSYPFPPLPYLCVHVCCIAIQQGKEVLSHESLYTHHSVRLARTSLTIYIYEK